jgi:hypothetical protein
MKQGEARMEMEGYKKREGRKRGNGEEKEKKKEEEEKGRGVGRLPVHLRQPSASERARFSFCEEHLLHIGQG